MIVFIILQIIRNENRYVNVLGKPSCNHDGIGVQLVQFINKKELIHEKTDTCYITPCQW